MKTDSSKTVLRLIGDAGRRESNNRRARWQLHVQRVTTVPDVTVAMCTQCLYFVLRIIINNR